MASRGYLSLRVLTFSTRARKRAARPLASSRARVGRTSARYHLAREEHLPKCYISIILAYKVMSLTFKLAGH